MSWFVLKAWIAAEPVSPDVAPKTVIFFGFFIKLFENGNFPNLGSFVTIYTGSTLIGSCELADYTRVGAHSLCINLKTNAHCTVIGNPAKERSIKIINE